MTMSMSGFSNVNKLRCEHADGFNHKLESWSLVDWMMAMMGEVGEAANIVKKLNRVRDGIPGNKVSEAELREMLAEELADVFIYLDLVVQSQGLLLEDIVRAKFNKTSDKLGCRIKI